MQRRLIQLSPSTSVISLPSTWIKAHHLKKGAELNLKEEGNTIIIATQSTKNEKAITLDISNLQGRMIWRVINEAYAAGHDEIIVKTKDAKQTAYMSTVAKNYHGMIIEEERNNTVHFRIMSDEEMDLSKILSRIFNLNIALLEDSLDAMNKNDWNVLVGIKQRDYIINTYIVYCLRHLSRNGYTPSVKLGAMHTFIKLLEILTDNFCILITGIGKARRKQDIKPILDLYRELSRLHFNFSQEKVKVFDEKREKLKFEDIANIFIDLEEMEVNLHLSTLQQ